MEFRVLEGVPPADVRAFLAMARRRTFDREEIVFHQGDTADALHLITMGRFALRVVSAFGDSAMLAVRGPCETFGEFALLATDRRRTVTVAAFERGETMSIGRDAFRDLVGCHPELNDVLVALLAERLRYSDERIVAAHFLDADARVRWPCSSSSLSIATAAESRYRSRRRASRSWRVRHVARSTAYCGTSRTAGSSVVQSVTQCAFGRVGDRASQSHAPPLLVARLARLQVRPPHPEATDAAQALRSRAASIIASTSGSSRPSSHAASIVSPSRMRNAERMATSFMPSGSNATSNARIASPFQSERSGTSTPSVCAQARCDQGESREIANGRMPAAARSSPLSRRRYSSFVQPGDQSYR